MPRDFTGSGGSEAPLRSTGHAWSTIRQMASPVPRADGVSSLRMAKNDELSSESDAIESTEGTTLAARFQALLSVAESISSCREPEELFGRLADELQRVVRFDFVGASCYDHERGVVRRAMSVMSRPSRNQAQPRIRRKRRTETLGVFSSDVCVAILAATDSGVSCFSSSAIRPSEKASGSRPRRRGSYLLRLVGLRLLALQLLAFAPQRIGRLVELVGDAV